MLLLILAKLLHLWPACGCNGRSVVLIRMLLNILACVKEEDEKQSNEDVHMFANDVSNFLAKSDNRFHILEEYFLKILCYSQHNNYRLNTLSNLIVVLTLSSFLSEVQTIEKTANQDFTLFLRRASE